MPEHQPQVDEVFDEALRRAAGPDRARYLDEACGGDLELRRRVERLLRAISEPTVRSCSWPILGIRRRAFHRGEAAGPRAQEGASAPPSRATRARAAGR